MTTEKAADAIDYAWCVNTVGFKVLHDVKEMVINVRLVSKVHFYKFEIRKSIFHVQRAVFASQT